MRVLVVPVAVIDNVIDAMSGGVIVAK